MDACPVGLIGPAAIGQDQDGDGCIDATEDDDDDNDGVLDLVDACAQTPQGAQVGVQGCSMTQLDDDLDGVSNAEDMCLNSLPVAVDENGCAVIDSSNAAKNQNDGGNGATTWLFVLAALLLIAAGVVASNGKPSAQANQTTSPPKRPVGLDDAVQISHDDAEEE